MDNAKKLACGFCYEKDYNEGCPEHGSEDVKADKEINMDEAKGQDNCDKKAREICVDCNEGVEHMWGCTQCYAIAQALRECKEEEGRNIQTVINAYVKELDKLRSELAEAKKREWCGSNDLVCGKAWKGEREKLVAELEVLQKYYDVSIATLDLISNHLSHHNAEGCESCENLAKSALSQRKGAKG